MYLFTSQGHAEDLVLWHRYNYYVHGRPLLTDAEYDALEQQVRRLWSVCICGVGGTVGSDDVGDYPRYIQLGVRPSLDERMARDLLIAERWINNL